MSTPPNPPDPSDRKSPLPGSSNLDAHPAPGSPSPLSALVSADSDVMALRNEVLSLRQQLEQLRAEFGAFRADATGSMDTTVTNPAARIWPHTGDSPASSEQHDETTATGSGDAGISSDAASTTTSRRDLLKWGGLGAAAAVAAAGGAALTSQTVHAADGDSLILGQSNSASLNTALVVSMQNALLPGLSINTLSTDNSIAFASVAGIHGVGVLGAATESDAYGVLGQSSSGTGVGGQSSGSGGIDLAALGTGRLWQKSSGTVGSPAIGKLGEQIRDNNGDLYICIADGLPGTWKKVAALDTHYNGGAIGFLSTPIRVYDSRKTGGPLVGNATRTVQVTGVSIGGVEVPAGATGCIGNLTVVSPSASGYLVIYPAGSPTPASSTVNFVANQTVPNSFAVGLNGSGQVTVHSFTSGSVQFILDITGFVA